jgi:hypothetical protein
MAADGFPGGDLAGVTRLFMSSLLTQDWGEGAAVMSAVWQKALEDGLVGPGEGPSGDPDEDARTLFGLLVAMENNRRANPEPQHPGTGDAAAIAAELATAEGLLGSMELVLARHQTPERRFITAAMHLNCAGLLHKLAAATGRDPAVLARIRSHLDQVPDDVGQQLPAFLSFEAGLRLYTGDLPFLDDAAARAGEMYQDTWDENGGDFGRAQAAAARAFASRKHADILAAIEEARIVLIGLPMRSPVRGQALTLLADTHLMLAVSGQDLTALPDVLGLAIAALRATSLSWVTHVAACVMVECLSQMAVIGVFQGPFTAAETELRRALARDDAGPAQRAALLAALGAVAGLRAAARDDEPQRQAARQLVEDAERTLPSAAPPASLDEVAWTLHDRTARALHSWTRSAILLGDAEMLPLALRVTGKLKGCLAAGVVPASRHDDLAKSRKELTLARQRADRGQPPASWLARWSARQSAGRWHPADQLTGREAADLALQALQEADALTQLDSPAPDLLLPAIAHLRRALSPAVDGMRVRHDIHMFLGLCLSRLDWATLEAGPRLLDDAITHLTLGLATHESTLPTMGRAYALQCLALCYRGVSMRAGDAGMRHKAERAMRAALRELRACAMIASTIEDAQPIAAKASKVAAQAVEWCLADGQERAAISIAEAGRALVLASVLVAGRAAGILRDAGEDEAANAWDTGTEAERAAALDALLNISAGSTLMAAPTDLEVSKDLVGTRLDAVVYLVAPDEASDPGTPGHAVLVRPLDTTQIEVLPLPGLALLNGMPLVNYLVALEGALTEFGRGTGSAAGFRGLSLGPAWADALDSLGFWTYETVMEPLIAHARGWKLGRLPRLALIPLGHLGAIPFAAAWTPGTRDPGTPGSARRYAIEDVVLSYAASARLLGEVARRPRQRLDERVVFVADPTGTFHFSRRILPGLAGRLYPSVKVYGLNRAPDGAATTEVLLGALPGSDRQGASLLHLITHGMMDPEPAMQTRDGMLPLARILRQARGRAPEAPGGLVITSACLTDVTLTDYDESLTLATAFLAAGATSVIGTRWPVDDDTTTALSVRLHHHLKDGHAPAEALRRAQLDLLRPGPALRGSLGPAFDAISDGRLSHPASWAGHVHHGI